MVEEIVTTKFTNDCFGERYIYIPSSYILYRHCVYTTPTTDRHQKPQPQKTTKKSIIKSIETYVFLVLETREVDSRVSCFSISDFILLSVIVLHATILD